MCAWGRVTGCMYKKEDDEEGSDNNQNRGKYENAPM